MYKRARRARTAPNQKKIVSLRAHVHVLEVQDNDVNVSIGRDTEEVDMGRSEMRSAAENDDFVCRNQFGTTKKIGRRQNIGPDGGLSHLEERMFN